MQAGIGQRKATVLVSGAGSAGISVTHWLRRYGFDVTVVEKAPGPRRGGFAIDLRGAAVSVARKMGVYDDCRRNRVAMREIVQFDREGNVVWRSGGNFDAGSEDEDVEILREEMNTIFLESSDGAEYLYGDVITSLAEVADGVHVEFERSRPRTFDFVIGADGLHSVVRSLAFGPDEQFEHPLGLQVAIGTIPNFMDMDGQWWMSMMPGRLASIQQYGRDKHTRGMLIFKSPGHSVRLDDPEAQKKVIREAFAEYQLWLVPQLIELIDNCSDLYYDDVTQVRMDSWSRGRVVLLGDAGYAPTLLSGQGTSLAVVGAYVLASELASSLHDHWAAFTRYEKVMRPYVEQNQALALGADEVSFPDTWAELEARDQRLLQREEARAGGIEQPPSLGDLVAAAKHAIDMDNYRPHGQAR